jgi:hypothetical protein
VIWLSGPESGQGDALQTSLENALPAMILDLVDRRKFPSLKCIQVHDIVYQILYLPDWSWGVWQKRLGLGFKWERYDEDPSMDVWHDWLATTRGQCDRALVLRFPDIPEVGTVDASSAALAA